MQKISNVSLKRSFKYFLLSILTITLVSSTFDGQFSKRIVAQTHYRNYDFEHSFDSNKGSFDNSQSTMHMHNHPTVSTHYTKQRTVRHSPGITNCDDTPSKRASREIKQQGTSVEPNDSIFPKKSHEECTQSTKQGTSVEPNDNLCPQSTKQGTSVEPNDSIFPKKSTPSSIESPT